MDTCPRCSAPCAPDAALCPACGEALAEPCVPRGTWNDPSTVTALPSPGEAAAARDQEPEETTGSSEGARSHPVEATLPAEEDAPERARPDGGVVVPFRSSHPPAPVPVPEPGRAEALEAMPALDGAASATQSHVERTGTHPRTRRPAEVVPLRERQSAAPGPEPERPVPTGTHRRPVLASESLREELLPAEPGRRLARVTGGLLGLLGAPAVLALPGPRSLAWWNATLLASTALAALLSIGYLRRALWLAAAALGGLAASGTALVAFVHQHEAGAPGVALWLVATPVLTAGLLLRAMHRASRRARIMVALGALPLLAWLLASGALAPRSLGSLEQALAYGAHLLVAASAALSLLAFMGPATTAAADRIAWAVLLAQGLLLGQLAWTGRIPVGPALAVVLFSSLGAIGLSEWLAWRERWLADRRAATRRSAAR